MITGDQILAHLFGDYVIQSDWMASEKTKRSLAAAAHALSYALPFLFLRPSSAALAVIVITHFIIDRWRLARFVVWAKNQLAPTSFRFPWSECKATGYYEGKPSFLSVWLLIVADNSMHLLCNGIAMWMFP